MAAPRKSASNGPLRTAQTAPGPPPRRRILAIDYGRQRCGLAISDELRLTVQPLRTLVRRNRRDDMRRLRQIAREQAVALIVVGHPLRLDGTAGEMSAEVARFAVRLGKELGLPVELADERLSSWEAEQMAGQSASGKRRARPTDEVAAAIILRDYLHRTRPAGKEPRAC